MKHKVAELEGAQLDAAVSKAGGGQPWEQPSTDWKAGGPVIEHARIELVPRGPQWHAGGSGGRYFGETPLIAAMRAYVASKFGDEIDLE